MDGNRFDHLARIAAQTRSRRGVLRLALAGAVGGALFANEAAAKRKKCKASQGKKRCNGTCVSIIADPNNCGDCGIQCGAAQTCQNGTCVGGGGGGLPLRAICDPQTDTCAAGLQCDAPTTRHTCSDTVAGVTDWCCVPPGGSCAECDCCGDFYCAFDNNNQGHCVCNPEGGQCSGGTCATSQDCNGNTPDCCGGTCVDTLGDPNNCGGCGNGCAAGQTCEAGLCSGGGGGGGDRCAGPVGICDADPTPCGHSATGETCGCELSVEGTNFCSDGANPCPNVVECTSTSGDEATSCRNLVGFHFFCQEAKRSQQFPGQFCGCGFGTQTGRVCVAECDNPDVFPAGHARQHRAAKRRHRSHR